MLKTLPENYPIIFTEESDSLLISVLHLLWEHGFVTMLIPVSSELELEDAIAQTDAHTIKKMDGLTMLRYVFDHWPEEQPIVILTQSQDSKLFEESYV